MQFTAERPLHVAIIGAGPAGFYAAESLLKQKDVPVTVDFFDRLPAPYGLVRYGVAPDHQKIKSVTRIYERVGNDERVRYFGNVDFGTTVTVDDILACYDQVIYAVGARSDRSLNIPGEDLQGSMSATEFVAWYNGHPDYVDTAVNLTHKAVAVIGVGNVAVDVSRVLAKSVEELQTSDIADHALDALRDSKVTEVYVFGRRGPAQAKFTNPEIREFGKLEVADPTVEPELLELGAASAAAIEGDKVATKNVAILKTFQDITPSKPRRVHFRFQRSPVEILGEDGHVTGIRIRKNRLKDDNGYINAVATDEFETIPVGMVLRSVGYRGTRLPGVPFEERKGTIPNKEGRVFDNETDELVPRQYVVGWAKRGPSGVIGTNKPDSVNTVKMMLEDAQTLEPSTFREDTIALLAKAGVQAVSFQEWKKLDAHEVAAGAPAGRPRVKVVTIDDMVRIAKDPS